MAVESDFFYRQYKIVPVFNYTNGKTDFHVYPPNAEFGLCKPSTTVSELIDEIDTIYSEENFKP